MKRKFLKKAIIATMSMSMLLSSLPLSNIAVYAAPSDSGTGNIGGNTVASGCTSIWQNNTGVRLYLVDASGGPGNLQVVPFQFNGNSYGVLDIWDPTYLTMSDTNANNRIYKYGVRVNNNSYDALKITYKDLTNAGLSSPDYVNSDDSDFTVSGSTFNTWMKSNSPGRSYTNMTMVMLGFMAGGNISTYKQFTNNYYLIAEPLVCMPAYKDNTYTNAGYRGTVIGTWYDYMRFNIGSNGGWSAAKARTFANGFKLGTKIDPNDPDSQAYADFVATTIKEDLGLDTPASSDYFGGPAGYHTYDYFNFVGNTGWGIQVYWDGEPPRKSGDPIDTYDIDNDPTNPDKPETPKTEPDPDNPDTPIYDSTGEKTIIKTYVDLYTDADNNSYYTKAIDQGTYIEHDTSGKVVITDESDQNGGYEIVAWYTSQTDTTDTDTYNSDSLHGTDMLQKTDHTDQLHQSIGKEQFTLDGYTSITGISDTGSKSYTYIDKGTPNSLSNNSPQYTKTDNIQEPIEKDDKDQYNTDEYIDLGTDNTIVLLYVREHDWINTETFTGGGHGTGTGSSGGGNGSGTGTGSGGTPEQGELKIVKAYGIVNPDTYEITNDKDTATIENVTRNVHITSESGYRLAEYVYSTRGNEDDVVWNNITASSWGTLTNTEQDDTVFYMKGFIDGFSEPYGSALYSSKYAWTDTEQPVGSLSSTYNSDLTYPGTYGTGRLSGNTLTNYNSTIYFDMDDPDNTDTTDDVLYILFLKEDEVEYSADNFVIPESFITRHNDFATNNITVTGNLTGETSSYLFAKHKFKYSLPLVTGFSESDGDGITAWTDPYIIASISQTNTATTNGLISKWSKTELITYNPTNDTIQVQTIVMN